MKEEIKIKEKRKREHIEYFLKLSKGNRTHFDDILLMNNSLPDLDFDEIDASCIFLNKKIDFPLMINAITGGFDEALEINRNLARLAKKFNIPMAVGSQTLALKNSKTESFKIVREILRDHIVIANVSASVKYEEAELAVEMIEGDALQLHLNVPQEMSMKEGDRSFKGILKNIESIAKKISVPVIVKEVGFGMSRQSAEKLLQVGVRYIDIGGSGGTNFIQIEDRRNAQMDFSDLYSWGIPTALSLIECGKIKGDLNIITSGGIITAEDIIKALCLGSKVVGISGIILREMMGKGYDSSEQMLEILLYKLKMIMLFLGSKNIEELKNASFHISGILREMTI